jgi:hypothetical protein
MLREDQSVEKASGPPPGTRLAIRYPSRRAASKAERRLVYVCRGVPPITSAEIEIMHQHLEESAREVRDAAQNDI